MTVVFVLAALGVVLVIGLLAVGRLGDLPEAEPDRTPDRLTDGPLDRADVDGVRFDVGLRGYRMDEVDEVLDRVAADLAARDAVIADLRARLGEDGTAVAAVTGPAPAAADPGPDAGDGPAAPAPDPAAGA